MGSVYKRGQIWWIKYSAVRGKARHRHTVRLSSGSENRGAAEAMLKTLEGVAVRKIAKAEDPGIYVLRSSETGLVKIGKSTNLTRRIADLQRMNASRLELVAYCSCANPGFAEEILHFRLAHCRQHGEWFRASLEDVLNAANTGGIPVPLSVPKKVLNSAELCGIAQMGLCANL